MKNKQFKIKTLDELKGLLESDQELRSQFKQDPVTALLQIQQSGSKKRNTHIVLLALLCVFVSMLIFGIILYIYI